MAAYINSTGLISPQQTFGGSFLEQPLRQSSEPYLLCIEPVYKEFINPVQLRRMSRILKMGLGASSICMNHLPDTGVDAIVVGTGLACIVDLEKFLLSVLNENEQMLSPIPFINSSHNTVAAQIAMMKQIKGYNNTYCHRGSSFEYALQDALMLLNEKEASCVLAGGIDEYSPHYFDIYNLLDAWRKEPVDNLSLFEGSHRGTIAGEGAGFFLLGNTRSGKTFARLTAVHSFLHPENCSEVEAVISSFLAKHNLAISDVDTVILGKNGDCVTDSVYSELETAYIPESTNLVYYKHLCGEYMTSSSFALWLAATILKKKIIPAAVLFRKGTRQPAKNILIYNHYRNMNHSLILLQAAD
ncbi:MAG: beta-ketoacyl synthase chain length factor [Prevotellaceae bacterium]|jgi:3-oxoacyl-(acyl-carrier-protein) synthase|nr:beta-ketoacyl synthase chain length factor [Prevotellaceae bacterium]